MPRRSRARSGAIRVRRLRTLWTVDALIVAVPVIALIAILPALKIAPWLYTYRLKSRIFHWYEKLTEVEVEMAHDRDRAAKNQYLARLDSIEGEIKAARLRSWLREQAYLLRGAVGMVRQRLLAPEDLEAGAALTAESEAADLGTPGGLA